MPAFRWQIPERFNMGADVSDRHGASLALIEIDPSGKTRELTFDAISALSNRLANVLVARGLQRGDRIAILLPQRHETAVGHVAAWKAGMISVPLFTLFGEEALEFRLQNCGARAIFTDREQMPKLAKLRDRLPDLQAILCVDGPAEGALDLHALAAQASDSFQVVETGAKDPGVRLRSLASGGESLGEDLIDWGRSTLGLTINEFYGQTECNLVVGNGSALPPVRPGWMGTAIPGHTVAIVDEDGGELRAGEMGSIAYHRPDPVMFLEYWRNDAATKAKFRGDWLISGDLGVRDEAGYFRFVGRDDDLITSGGYRIGPGEIEACLSRHPAVALAAVVGEPDPIRTEAVKAVIVLKEGFAPGEALKSELQEHVRSRLAAHEYPRIVEFVRELPLTATGKIIRRALRSPKKH